MEVDVKYLTDDQIATLVECGLLEKREPQGQILGIRGKDTPPMEKAASGKNFSRVAPL